MTNEKNIPPSLASFAVGERDRLRAELSRLKAGQGDAVAEVVWSESSIRRGAFRALDGSDLEVGTKLYTSPPSNPGTVTVRREMLEIALSSPATSDQMLEKIRAKAELRALLAQYEGVKP